MANVKFTADEIEKKINDYFSYCNSNNKPFTMSGLALFLECSRTTLFKYENELIEFFNCTEEDKNRIVNAIKRAKQIVEAYQEELLLTSRNPAGTIFSLKNNFNWKDIQEVNSNITAKNPLQELTTEEIKQLLEEGK